MSASCPDDLRYSTEHEWVRVEGSTRRRSASPASPPIELGDIVYVELPEIGRNLDQFASFGVVESVKAVSDLFAPVSARRAETNAELRASPELLNSDPFGDGWIAKVTLADAGRARPAARRRRVRRALSRRLMAYSPHTAADRERMLAAIGVASVDDLFADIPAAVRAPASTCRGPHRAGGAAPS